jgi:LPXTG-site transpeptidase (sortase) family protein
MWRLVAVLAAVAVVAAALASRLPGGEADAASSEAEGLAAAIRYIGRDWASGMPVPVGDRYIAGIEEAYERYGQDEREPVPPPPVAGTDIERLVIPALAIDARVNRYGLDAFGRLDVPQDATTVGWQPAYSDLPGSDGSTFLAAHFEFRGAPGVFWRLATLRTGDEVEVRLTDGTLHHYRVTSTTDYPLAAIDMGAILQGREGVESLTLMTCSGPANEGEYAFRTVVLAERVER